ncbi:MAG: hypothetical protein Q4G10_02870 [Bacteroidia bacterium]|nr:hypothetical protein [Bacteroidia bacterium]
MRRLFNILGCVAAFAGIIAGMTACDPYGIRHRNGGYDPDPDPWRGGGERGGGNSSLVTLEYGYADFWGQWYTDNTDNFLLVLYAGETDSEGYFNNSGVILTLDLLLPKKGSLDIASATYKCSDEGDYYTFIPTYKSSENDYEGSALYIQKSKNSFGYYAITGGTVSISRKVTGIYDITADIVVEGNLEYHFTFKGMIDIEDKTQSGGDVDPVDPGTKPSFPGILEPWKARAQYNGKCVDNNKVDEYTLYLSAGTYASNGIDFVTEGTEIAIEVLTNPSDGRTIPAGTYTCTSTDPQPFRFYDGYEHDGQLEPSFFYRQYSTKEGDFSLESITSGTLEVGRTGDEYAISFTFGCASGSYKVTYDGGIDFYTATKSVSAAKSAARASANGRTMASVKRNVPLNRVTR